MRRANQQSSAWHQRLACCCHSKPSHVVQEAPGLRLVLAASSALYKACEDTKAAQSFVCCCHSKLSHVAQAAPICGRCLLPFSVLYEACEDTKADQSFACCCHSSL